MSDTLPLPRLDLLVHSPSPAPYVPLLSTLLEPSPPLSSLLAPQIQQTITALPAASKPKNYHQLLDLAAQEVEKWDVEDQAAFLAAHPRIGEVNGLSKASEGEQAPKPGQGTPGEVLKRLGVRSLPASSCSNAADDLPILPPSSRRASTPSTNKPSPVYATSPSSTAAPALKSFRNSRCVFPFLLPHPFPLSPSLILFPVPFLARPLLTRTHRQQLQGLLLLSLPPPSPSVGEPKLGELRAKLRINPTGSGPWRAELKRGIEDMWKIAHSRVDKY